MFVSFGNACKVAVQLGRFLIVLYISLSVASSECVFIQWIYVDWIADGVNSTKVCKTSEAEVVRED